MTSTTVSSLSMEKCAPICDESRVDSLPLETSMEVVNYDEKPSVLENRLDSPPLETTMEVVRAVFYCDWSPISTSGLDSDVVNCVPNCEDSPNSLESNSV